MHKKMSPFHILLFSEYSQLTLGLTLGFLLLLSTLSVLLYVLKPCKWLADVQSNILSND